MLRALLPFLFALVAPVCAAADAKPADSLVGTWRGSICGNMSAFDVRVDVRAQGKEFAGTALMWQGIPEDVAMTGGKVTGYAQPLAITEAFRIARRDDQVGWQGDAVKTLIGGGGCTADVLALKEIEPGLLAGTSLGKDGKSIDDIVLLCSDARWKAPALPAPPIGQTTAIACLGCSYHYLVYVPKTYDPTKPAPLVVHSSPVGNAAPLSIALADEYGWIMVGLTEAKNGDWRPIVQNREAALFDVRQRLAIDWSRVFFAGDSGGARASALSAMTHPGMCAGLLLSIASYPEATPPHPRIPIFFITGDTDMNLAEVTAAYEQAKAAKRPTELLRHHGGHENGGAQNIEQALRWLHDHQAPFASGGKPAANRR